MFELVLLAPFDAMKRSGTLSSHATLPRLSSVYSAPNSPIPITLHVCVCVCHGADQLTKEESAVKRSLMNLSLMIGP